MRYGWLGLVGLVAACSQAESLGSYRLPMPGSSSSSVALVTVLAREDEGSLILFDTSTSQELGRGRGDLSLMDPTAPFVFSVPASEPLQLVAVDGVMQDVASRAYQRVPLAPLEVGASSVRRITLSSDSDRLELVATGGALFTETAAVQPANLETPSPLFALSSIAGAGLALPSHFETAPTWRDAISQLVPPDPKMPIACAAPFVSTSRTESVAGIDVPAGHFDAVRVVEVMDNCRQPNPPTLLVYRVDRWFARGVGPVRLMYTDSASRVHEYRLKEFHVAGGSLDVWPLDEGNSWTFEIVDGAGAPLAPAATATVSKSVVVSQP